MCLLSFSSIKSYRERSVSKFYWNFRVSIKIPWLFTVLLVFLSFSDFYQNSPTFYSIATFLYFFKFRMTCYSIAVFRNFFRFLSKFSVFLTVLLDFLTFLRFLYKFPWLFTILLHFITFSGCYQNSLTFTELLDFLTFPDFYQNSLTF